MRTPIEYCHPAVSKRLKTSVFQNPGSARNSLTPLALVRVKRAISSSHPPARARRSLSQPDIEHLTSVSSGGEDRVIPEHLRVPIGGALLQAAAHLTDEAVHIDHQPPVAPVRHPRTNAFPSSASGRRTRPNVNARTNVASVEGAGIELPKGDRVLPACSTAQSSTLFAPSTIVTNSAITLRPAFRRAWPVAPQPRRTPRQRLDPQPPRERCNQHQPGLQHGPLVVERPLNPCTVEWDSLPMPNVTLTPTLAPEECRIAVAAWKAYPSPSHHRWPLGSCATGGHRPLVDVQTPDNASADSRSGPLLPVLLS
jgi:hypothetical protein